MAKISWLELSKVEGDGDATVNVSALEHTGRSDREITLVWWGDNVTPVNRKVKQLGKAEFVKIPDTEYTISQTGGTLSISGTSNSKTLYFSKQGSGTLNIDTPTTYYIGSTVIKNGEGHEGDPGKDQEYEFRIVFDIPANEGLVDKTVDFMICGNNTDIKDYFTIKSSKASATLSVTPEEGFILNAAGGTAVFEVDSNIHWKIKAL